MGFLGSMFGGFGGNKNNDGGDNTGQSPLANSGMGAMQRFQSMGGFGGLKQPGGMAGGQQGMPQVGSGMGGGLSRGFGNMASGFGALAGGMGQKAPMTEQAPSGQQFGQGNMPGGMAMSMDGSSNRGMTPGGVPTGPMPSYSQAFGGGGQQGMPIGGMNSMQRFAQHMAPIGQQMGQSLDKFGAGNAYKPQYEPPPGFSGNPQTAPINRMPDFFRTGNSGFNPGASQEPRVEAPGGEGFSSGKYPGGFEDFFKQINNPNNARLMVEPQQNGGMWGNSRGIF